MRKLLIGCGIVALLAFCLVVGVAIWGVMKVKKFNDGLVKVKAAYEATNRSYPFTPPDPPAMRAERFEKYLAVRSELAKSLQGELDQLNELDQAAKNSGGRRPQVGFSDVFNMFGLPERIGTAHVKALERQSMSVDEYLWHSKIVLGTIHQAVEEGKEIADELKKPYGDVGAGVPGSPSRVGPSAGGPGRPGSGTMTGIEKVPLLESNLKLINEAKDELVAQKQLIGVDVFMLEIGLSPSSGTPTFPTGAASPTASPPGQSTGSYGGNPSGLTPEATPVPAR